MFDIEIYRRKTAVMQAIQKVASKGYVLYISGEIEAKKALGFAEKMNSSYGICRNENQRYYAKKQGKANTFLYMYPIKNSTKFLWWILVTEGKGDIVDKERLISIYDKSQRLTWAGDYELITVPRENAKPAVTWRMTRKCYQSWNDRIRQAIRARYNNDLSQQALWSLSRAPGFSGIRDQVKRLQKTYAGEWKRTRRNTEDMPKIKPIGYLRMQTADKYPLSVISRRIKMGISPFPKKENKDD